MKKGIAIFSAVVLIAACTKDKVEVKEDAISVCDTEISYANTIEPLINANCSTSGCHDASTSGGYVFTSHAEVSANADIILNVINHDQGVTAMPLGQNKLPDADIQNFDCWIQQGKQNN